MSVRIENIKNRIRRVRASNKNDLYNSNIYWSQKPYNICDILIEELTKQGDIVFDPFMGSGVTILEAIKNTYKRNAIGCEINEVPIFIVKTLLAANKLKNIHKYIAYFRTEIERLYDYYYIICEKCGNEKAVISSVVFDKPNRKSSENITCINYRCGCCGKSSKKAEEADYKNMNICSKLYKVDDLELIQNTKIAVYEGDRISTIFTKRNLLVLDRLLLLIDEYPDEYKGVFKYIMLSMLHLAKITDTHSNSQWPLWIPKKDCVEKNIIDLYIKKIDSFLKMLKYVRDNYDDDNLVEQLSSKDFSKCVVLHKGSQEISDIDIASESVDLIITDPPYLGQVAYSEYMQLYKPFMKLDFNLEDEIIVSNAKNRKKTEDDYFYLLDKVFEVCSKKLKNNHYMCLYFHDSSLVVWRKLIDILEKNNFQYLSQIHIKKSNTLKNIISPKKSLNGDSILFFIKNEAYTLQSKGAESIEEIEMNIIKQAKFLIKNYGKMSTPELYDNGLMEVLISNNWLTALSEKYTSLVELFEKHICWDSKLGLWYI